MLNPVKYTTTTPSGSLRKSNMAIGVDPSVALGPTSTTGFYAGITPPAGGYTIYQNKVSGGPSIYVVSNDTELVNYTNTQVAGTVASPAGYTTAAQCLSYYAGQTDKICANLNYEGIVTSGSVFHMDAGYTVSYPTTSSTWYDLSGNSRNSTLFNTPAFSASNSGSITFSTSSLNYATASNIGSISRWTAECWVKFNSTTTNQVAMVIGNQFNGSNAINFTIGTNGAPTSWNIQAGFFDGGWRNTTGFAPVVGTWYQIVGTYDGTTIRQYVNGAANGGTLTYSGTPTSGGEIRMMRRWDDIVSTGNLFNGNLAIARVYNRALTAAEVLQNYNAQKGRFGL